MKLNRPLVSIIIPVYNGEKYIIKCLNSIAGQNYSAMEIVAVDDGSTDKSVGLIRAYAEKTSVPVILVSQKNQGQGAARNTGIDNVSGEYLMFVDQDDTIEPRILTKLLKKAVVSRADIVSCGYRRITAGGKIEEEVRLGCTEWSKYKIIAPWAKLYKTEFVTKNEVRFLPVALGEDIYFMMNAYSYKPKVDFLCDIGYNWLDNAASVSNTDHRRITDKTSLLQLLNRLEGLEKKENLKRDSLYEYFLIKTALWDILYTAGANSYDAVLSNSTRIWDWFDIHFKGYMDNPYIRISRPRGESLKIRMVVWGYILIKKLGLEKTFLRILSKKGFLRQIEVN